jgi:hypothetical protein
VEAHDNLDPGTHNYGADNRRRLYAFLNRRFGLSTPEHELPWKNEVLTEKELEVGLPPGNAGLMSIALDRARDNTARKGGDIGRDRKPETRRELRDLLRLPGAAVSSARRAGIERIRGCSFSRLILRIDGDWSLPVVHMRRPPTKGRSAKRSSGGLVLAIHDGGRRKALRDAMSEFGSSQPGTPTHVARLGHPRRRGAPS